MAEDGRAGMINSPLRHLDVATVSANSRHERRCREHHLPPISTFRWWARRTLSTVTSILDAVALDSNNGSLVVCDPFAGGGTVGLASLLHGNQTYLQELNPWASYGLTSMFSLPSSDRIHKAANALHLAVSAALSDAYQTQLADGSTAYIAHTLRVATADCPSCNYEIQLYPFALVSLTKRVESGSTEGWLACPAGHLFHANSDQRQLCPKCGIHVHPEAKYTSGRRIQCPSCCEEHSIAELVPLTGFNWKIALVDRVFRSGRQIDLPSTAEVEQGADSSWAPKLDLGPIPEGRESDILKRFGYRRWQNCYPARQRYILEQMIEASEDIDDIEQSAVLQLAILGSTEMAGYLSRWDRRYLKAYEAMAGHRFNVTTLACEPNVWGVMRRGRGTIQNRIHSLAKASDWFKDNIGDFEIDGPLLCHEHRRSRIPKGSRVRIVTGSSERILLPKETVDLVLTDPPYHDDVDYGNLSTLFRAWKGDNMVIAGEAIAETRNDKNYIEILSSIFKECHRILKTNGHMIITYANRQPEAWIALFSALKTADFKACGYEILHSENETDITKRNNRACTLDLVLDLMRSDGPDIQRPISTKEDPSTVQEHFCLLVGELFLEVLGPNDSPNWQDQVTTTLMNSEFLIRA